LEPGADFEAVTWLCVFYAAELLFQTVFRDESGRYRSSVDRPGSSRQANRTSFDRNRWQLSRVIFTCLLAFLYLLARLSRVCHKKNSRTGAIVAAPITPYQSPKSASAMASG
jgi:hypothetical protein